MIIGIMFNCLIFTVSLKSFKKTWKNRSVMCIHWGLVIYYLCGGRGELFWESLEDFQNNLQFIIATLDKIALEGNAPAPGSSVLLSSKESLISEHFVGSNFKLGEGLTLLKAIDLERVLLHKRVRIEEKMFSSSFVRDCSFLKVTLNTFQLLWKWPISDCWEVQIF